MALSSRDVDVHVERVRADGYTVVEGAIELELAEELARDLARIEAEQKVVPASNIFEGLRTVRIYNLLARGRVYEKVPVHQNVLPIVERVLDKGCLVSSLSSIGIDPGEDAQILHADDQLIPLPKPHIPIICNTMWALTDFTAENGATRVVPGSHRRDRSPDLGEAVATIPAEMKRGSVLIFDGSIWHGGGANRSPARRLGVAMNYCSGWMRQQENQQLGIPLAVARGFSDRLRQLCGFGLYRGLIGHIDKCSPVDALDGTGPRPVVGVVGRGQ
ncbi:MAG TPA: phytanoyl-CoA dioxygenase family protein [Polyangiaceae bacterium]|nr:phytanoyl-CoA dioxygenase family protein [Polyangiaceae bacterium]